MAAKKKTSTKKTKKEKPVLEYTDGKSCDTLSSRAKGLDEILVNNRLIHSELKTAKSSKLR